MKYILSYDIGTTGVKTCLYKVDKSIVLLGAATKGYGLYILPNGGAEQDNEEWYQGMIETTKDIFKSNNDLSNIKIDGISFCSQMQGLILVDKLGNPVHRPMSYMDQRAKDELKKGIAYGLKIAGANIFKLIPSLIITGAVTSSVKDPVWKYKWLEAHEPENFKKAYKWLDVKDYLISRLTGEFTMTQDSAFATLIYDTRKGKEGWSKKMCKMFNINMDHLPKIIKSTDCVGKITEKAAEDLGINSDALVFGGGGDSSLIGVGAGSVNLGDTYIYSGTSGWVTTIVDKQMVDAGAMIAAVTGAQSGKFNYFAEMETAGKCLEWVKDHLALDEINIYVEKKKIVDDYESKYASLYDYLTSSISNVPPGSNGVIFTPWLHGNRCPFEDPNSVGSFIGVKLENGKTDLIKSVLEGVFYHLRWMLECENKKVKVSDKIRFVGGGALSSISCQMLSDITGHIIETVDNPQNVGAVGAAVVAAVGLGEFTNIEDIKDFIPATKTYYPNLENHKLYNKYYEIFKKIYKTNRHIYKDLSKGE